MTAETLYLDDDLMITSGPNGDDHLLIMGDLTYILDRGILEDLARAPNSDFVRRLETIDDRVVVSLPQLGVSTDKLYNAVCEAYRQEQKNLCAFIDSLKSEE